MRKQELCEILTGVIVVPVRDQRDARVRGDRDADWVGKAAVGGHGRLAGRKREMPDGARVRGSDQREAAIGADCDAMRAVEMTVQEGHVRVVRILAFITVPERVIEIIHPANGVG